MRFHSHVRSSVVAIVTAAAAHERDAERTEATTSIHCVGENVLMNLMNDSRNVSAIPARTGE